METTKSLDVLNAERTERMLRELASDLADLVASGDMTAEQANEWMIAKQDQWAQK